MEVEPARLAEPAWPRLAQPGSDRDDRSARLVADGLELVPLAHCGLVNVPGEDQVGARVDERLEDVVAPRDGTLAGRPPWRAEEMVVEDGNAQGAVCGGAEAPRGPVELRAGQRSALMPERPRRVEPDDVEPRQRDRRLGRVPDSFELRPGTVKTRRRVGEVVVAGNREHRRAKRSEQRRRPLELVATTAIREIAGRDNELRLRPLDEARKGLLDLRFLVCTGV
jgi:hypothetical protein